MILISFQTYVNVKSRVRAAISRETIFDRPQTREYVKVNWGVGI